MAAPGSLEQPAARPAAARRPPAGGTRERLVAAAGELLGRGGPDEVTLRSVGQCAGVSRTAPYRHFRDKQDLLAAVAAEGFRLLRADIAEAISSPGGGQLPAPLATLHRVCVAYVRAGLARPQHYRLMFGDRLAGRAHPELELVAGDGAAFFLALIEECQRAGSIRPADTRDVAAMLWSMLHGMVELDLAGHLQAAKVVDIREAAPRLLAHLLSALAS